MQTSHIPLTKRAAPDANTTALEREIDERVYRLYGLTADEIKLVEENTTVAPERVVSVYFDRARKGKL
jgi:hypothetical protein